MSGKVTFLKLSILAVILAALGLSAGQCYAQSQAITASFSGTVLDPSGQAINGAKVTLVSPERGISRTYVTTDNGLYSFTLLPPATYKLQIEAAGFKHYRQEGIELIPGQTAEEKISLSVGAVTESVEVSSQAPLLNAENANISSDISARQVVELPLNFRSVIALATLSSSVSNAAEDQVVESPGISGSADQDVSFLNFGGTFFNTAAYLLDGTYDTRLDWGGVVYVPVCRTHVQEFKIQTNAFTAQYGWSSGNVINVVTKSGSNGFHGDAYEFYRNSNVDAKYFFNNGKHSLRSPAISLAALFGGPIRKNKTFFFGYYEGPAPGDTGHVRGHNAYLGDERTGNFSALLGAPTGQTDCLGRPILSGANLQSVQHPTDYGREYGPDDRPGRTHTGYIRDPFPGNIIPPALMDKIAQEHRNRYLLATPHQSATSS